MKAIITTVGTSLFTNYMSESTRNFLDRNYTDIKEGFEKLENKYTNEYDEDNEYIKDLKEVIESNWITGLKVNKDKIEHYEGINENSCAEIKSIIKIKEELEDKDLEIFLLASDTVLSKLACEIIKNELIKDNNIKVSIHVIEGLQVNDSDIFKSKGLTEFVNTFKNIIEECETDFKNIIINPTGGYKAVIPFLTILAQLYKFDIKYIYENSNELITIPKLPIQFDWTVAERYYDFLIVDKDKQPVISKFNIDEVDLINELESTQLISVNKQENTYITTGLGLLFRNFIEKNLEIAQDVMGFFMEYKILEYYIKHPYKGEYNFVERSKKIEFKEENKNSELDLVMKKSKQETDYIAVESKSYFGVQFVKEQIEKQIYILKSINQIPKEYILIFYLDIDKKRFQSLSKIKNHLEEIRELFNDTGCIFKAYYFEVKLKSDNRSPNPYKKFMSNKKIDIKSYNF